MCVTLTWDDPLEMTDDTGMCNRAMVQAQAAPPAQLKAERNDK